MSAEIIQFVPRANPNREAPLCNAPDVLGVPSSQVVGNYGPLTIQGCKYWTDSTDTAPSEYVAPSDDCA
ncbi:hypothetical protein AB8A05_04120 [Tardiphaga sp. 538_B7_N1_4]|uniref:hypothetical protein n=1 Tax=Tardiphaga sp. 538_B7_N1_4 TaxID=3240778 RepID=UPI003F1EC4A6